MNHKTLLQLKIHIYYLNIFQLKTIIFIYHFEDILNYTEAEKINVSYLLKLYYPILFKKIKTKKN